MRVSPTRVVLLAMGTLSTVLFVIGYATGTKPDDALLVFAGSMFTTYALTEPRDRDDDDDKDDRGGGGLI